MSLCENYKNSLPSLIDSYYLLLITKQALPEDNASTQREGDMTCCPKTVAYHRVSLLCRLLCDIISLRPISEQYTSKRRALFCAGRSFIRVRLPYYIFKHWNLVSESARQFTNIDGRFFSISYDLNVTVFTGH